MTIRELGYALAAGLLVNTACGSEATGPRPPSDGALRITTVTTGADFDDRYLVTIQTGTKLFGYLWIQPNATYVMPVPIGPVTLDLGDLASNCAGSDANPLTLSVGARDTASATFQVQCTALARVEVRVSTSGVDRDIDGYWVQLNEYLGGPVIASFALFKVTPGTYHVTLGGVASNCATDPDTARTIAPAGGDTARLAWTVSCSLITSHRLLFEDWAVSGGEIYVRNPGTGLVVNVSNSEARDTLPAWAPDGSAIAFVSRRTGNDEIFMVRPDGSGLTNLTNSSAAESDPAWSPDGTRIAFVSNRDGNREIYVMNADGSDQIRLTSDTAPDNTPAWSPDGTRIAFLRGCVTLLCTRHADLYVMTAKGAGPAALTSGAMVLDRPVWSPDGSRIAFLQHGLYCSLISVNGTDGSGTLTVGTSASCTSSATWSPDGTQIALVGDPLALIVANADGSESHRIAWGTHPAWSPDGTRIAGVLSVCGGYYGSCDVFLVNPDGTGWLLLTRAHNVGALAWSPR